MKIGLIGTGHIGVAMVHNLAQAGHDIMVSRRSEVHSSALVAAYHNVSAGENDDVMSFAETVIVAVRPTMAESVLASLNFNSDQKLLSVMAAVSFETLRTLAKPATKIAVTIPLECVSNGGCPLPVFGNQSIVHELFGHNNPIVEVKEEAHLNGYFSASTVLTSVMDIMAASRDWLGDTTANASGAEVYVNALTSSYLRDLFADGEGALEKWRHRLAAEGTLNRQMLDHMEVGDARSISHGGHEAIMKRLSS